MMYALTALIFTVAFPYNGHIVQTQYASRSIFTSMAECAKFAEPKIGTKVTLYSKQIEAENGVEAIYMNYQCNSEEVQK